MRSFFFTFLLTLSPLCWSLSTETTGTDGYLLELSPAVDPKAFSVPEGTTITKVYDHALLNGVVVRVESTSEEVESSLSALAGVVKVWPNHRIRVNSDAQRRRAKRSKKAKEFGKRAYQPPSADDAAFKNSNFRPHLLVNATELHKMGILGQGVRVAIIDEGFDYTHPLLGGCFGLGCKVSFGKDMVGDNLATDGYPTPDDDPLETCGDVIPHGTEVASLIAADPHPDFPYFGISPLAELGFYRVFSCGGWVDAMLAAVDDDADIINMSLLYANGPYWEGNLVAVMADRIIRETGKIIVAANGNDGDFGLFSMGGPAMGPSVWAVGNSRTSSNTLFGARSSFNSSVQYWSYFSFKTQTLPLFDGTNPNQTIEDDACNPFPAGTDLSGFVTLVRIGGCRFGPKIQNLVAAGATYVFLAATHNESPGTTAGFDNGLKGIGYINISDYQSLKAALGAGETVTLDFSDSAPVSEAWDDPNAGYPFAGSSWGPALSQYGPVMNPSFNAPGVNIFSCVFGGGYALFTGTSASSPVVAGALALVLSLNASFPDTIAAVPQAGSGRIDTLRALHSQIVFEPYALNLNDTEYFVSNHTFTVSNLGQDERRFIFRHLPSVTALAVDSAISPCKASYNRLADGLQATVSLPDFVTVPAGGSVNVTVNFDPPEANPDYPVYSGHILLEDDSSKEQFNVPYVGMAAAVSNLTCFA
ncbi:subtilisin-like protein [Atractiella rhizophila]|nr:subtilisin-like protein [Atractiella rhizophila]